MRRIVNAVLAFAIICLGVVASQPLRLAQSQAVSVEASDNPEIKIPAPAADAAPPVGGDGVSAVGLVQPFAYIKLDTVWRFADGDPKIVFVCWENPGDDPGYRWTREAVLQSWEANTGLLFRGWQACPSEFAGIRIRVSEEGPHVKVLGNRLAGMGNGMVLNFSFQTWSRECQGMREFCIKAIAVHEFGHALGYAHEQNRPDAPGECRALAQGSNGDLLLTPYDPDSVMNYCNPKYSNNGILSDFDRISAQRLYCSPQSPLCSPQV